MNTTMAKKLPYELKGHVQAGLHIYRTPAWISIEKELKWHLNQLKICHKSSNDYKESDAEVTKIYAKRIIIVEEANK